MPQMMMLMLAPQILWRLHRPFLLSHGHGKSHSFSAFLELLVLELHEEIVQQCQGLAVLVLQEQDQHELGLDALALAVVGGPQEKMIFFKWSQ
jgi:hypothetical protein